MIAKPALLSLAVAGLILGASGCSSDSDTATPGSDTSSAVSTPSSAPSSGTESSEAAATATITIKDFKFDGPDSVPAGAMVMVVNEDDVAHDVTAEGDGGFVVELEPGGTAMFTAPSEPGDYPYVCTIHPGMKGTLVVA